MGIGAIIGVVSTAVGVVGQFQQASASAAASEHQAAVDRNNAIIAGRLALDARRRGVIAEQEAQLETQGVLGQQRAVLSARNLDIGSGSALDILGDTAMFGALDALTIRHNYEREAIAFETQQQNFSASAEMNTFRARNARTAGVFNAFSTALGGFNQIYSGWQ